MCMHLVLPERLPAESHLLSVGTEQAMSTKHRTTYPLKPLLSRRRELAAVNPSPRASVQLRLCTAPAARQQVPPHRRHQYHSALLNLRPQMQSQRPRNRSRSGVVRGGDALPVRQLMLELTKGLHLGQDATSPDPPRASASTLAAPPHRWICRRAMADSLLTGRDASSLDPPSARTSSAWRGEGRGDGGWNRRGGWEAPRQGAWVRPRACGNRD